MNDDHEMIPTVLHKVIIVDGGDMPTLPTGMETAIESFRIKNPGYQLKLYSGQDCVQYIKDHFEEETLDAYHRLKPYSYRCDLMRHLILYREGGWYTDARMECLEPLDHLTKSNHEYYTTFDTFPNNECLYTGFIGSIANHPISRKMIDLILWNVKHKHYGRGVLTPTGPDAYMNAAVDHIRSPSANVCIGFRVKGIIKFKDVHMVKVKYNDAEGGDNTDLEGTNNYIDMWYKGDVYTTSPKFH